MSKPIVFFDMDGFIARYERWAYQPDLTGISPFENETFHYFRTCERDEYAYALIKEITKTYNTYFLTTVPVTMPWHIMDKIQWIKEKIPEIDPHTKLLIANSDKSEVADVLLKTKTLENVVLFDDYNPNLIAWRNAGGIAIKYLNGVNSPDSYDGVNISDKTPIPDVIKLLNYITNFTPRRQ